MATSEVISLYRSFIRAANGFDNYNFRSYFLRRTRDSFRSVAPADVTPDLLANARKELAVLQRQSTISKMYHFDSLVVEKL